MLRDRIWFRPLIKMVITTYIAVVSLSMVTLLTLKITGVLEIEWFWLCLPLWAVPAAILSCYVSLECLRLCLSSLERLKRLRS